MRPASLLAGALLLVACQGQQPAPPPPSPTASPTTAVALATPAAAILADADVGLPRTAGTDALTAAELAAGAPDQVVALTEVSGWGWSTGARRTWSGGGRGVEVMVVATTTQEGARRAYSYLAAQAATAPLAAGPCPVAVSGLDECTAGSGGGRQVFAGRLDSEVFELVATGFDATSLAARQAGRLRRG